jgi:hypothetical protein
MARVSPRLISLEVDGDDRSDEISKAVIKSAKSAADFMSFLEARSGGARDYTLELTIAQDHASGTLWNLIWTGAGTEVDGVYAPYGNLAPSVAQPHYAITVKVSEPDGDMFGAEADESTTAVATIEVAWALTGRPVPITA